MNIYRLIAALNVLGFLATIIANYLAVNLPINGKTTGELSDAYPNLFVPAGLTFSIWGVIYTFLLLFVLYPFLFGNLKDIKNHHFLSRISFFFVYSCIANISWILLWHYELVAFSFFVMVTLLVSLIYIYIRLEVGKRSVPSRKRWFVHIPFSIYLGWITVATIANATALLVDLGWNGFNIPESIWAIIMIFAAIYIGLKVLNDRSDIAFTIVLIWAFLGIFIKRNNLVGPYDTVGLAAAFGILILLGSILWEKWKPKKALIRSA